jgi:hypothetical protein
MLHRATLAPLGRETTQKEALLDSKPPRALYQLNQGLNRNGSVGKTTRLTFPKKLAPIQENSASQSHPSHLEASPKEVIKRNRTINFLSYS